MKKIILGTFESRPGARTLIHHLRKDLNLPEDDISCIYRDSSGEVYEVTDPDTSEEDAEEELTSEVKTGSLIGGSIGVVGGVAMLLGVIPALGPILDTNIFVKVIGLGASAVGSIALGALIGAVIGGITASLFGGSEVEKTNEASYAPRSSYPGVLVVAHARDEQQVGRAFTFYGASGVEVYTPTLS